MQNTAPQRREVDPLVRSAGGLYEGNSLPLWVVVPPPTRLHSRRLQLPPVVVLLLVRSAHRTHEEKPIDPVHRFQDEAPRFGAAEVIPVLPRDRLAARLECPQARRGEVERHGLRHAVRKHDVVGETTFLGRDPGDRNLVGVALGLDEVLPRGRGGFDGYWLRKRECRHAHEKQQLPPARLRSALWPWTCRRRRTFLSHDFHRPSLG